MKMKILNLTQHETTEKQKEMGVEEPDEQTKKLIRQLLTYNEFPETGDILRRAEFLTSIVSVYFHTYIHQNDNFQNNGHIDMGVMLGGANFSNPVVEHFFLENGVPVYYSFSPRIAKEEKQDDGTVKTEYIFDFKGLIRKIKNNENSAIQMNILKYGEDPSPNDIHNTTETPSGVFI